MLSYTYHLIENRHIDSNDPFNNYAFKDIIQLKKYKIKLRNKLVYIIELHYYKEFTFVKFYPKIHANNPDKYKIVGLNLKLSEIRRILNTCCLIVKNELLKRVNLNFAFIGQPYFKDDIRQKIVSKRFELYLKQVTTYFIGKDILHFKLDAINFYSISLKNKIEFKKDIQSLINHLEQNEDLFFSLMTKARKELIELNYPPK